MIEADGFMPDTKADQPNTPDLDAQIEALLADMASACDRVAKQLEDRPPPSREEIAQAAVKEGGAFDDRGQRAGEAPEAEDAEAGAEDEALAEVEEEADHLEGFDLGDEPAGSTPEGDEAEAVAESVALDAQVGELIDAAVGEPGSPSASESDSEPGPGATNPDAPENLGDLDAELAALAGEMMAESEPYAGAAPSDERHISATDEAPPVSVTDDAPGDGTSEEASSAAAVEAATERAAPAPPAARSEAPTARPRLRAPSRPSVAPGSNPWAVASAHARVYAPWLASIVFAQLMRLFIWAAPRLGDLAERSNRPVENRPRVVRQSVGWFAVMTAFYALLAWVFVLFIREPPQPTEARTPAVEVRDPNAPEPLRRTPSVETPPR